MNYELLTNREDEEIVKLKEILGQQSIKKYINVSENFFDYVTLSPNVLFYKLKLADEVVGGLQLEKDNQNIYIAVWIRPDKQQQGFASKVLQDLINGNLGVEFERIVASIDKDNFKSINLFKKLGFIEDGQDEELIYYVYNKK